MTPYESDVLAELERRINELNGEIQLKDSKIKILESFNHTLKVKCDDLIDDLDAKTRKLREIIEELEARVRALLDENKESTKKIEELSKELEYYKKDICGED